jgi:predicted site-specific integrase-resolvase
MEDFDGGAVGTVILAHNDPLTRLGCEWFEWRCQQCGRETLVLNQERVKMLKP